MAIIVDVPEDLTRVDSAPDQVATFLRQAIFDGRIKGGMQIKQNDVASSLGVSAVPVREALKKLTAEGLLRNERNKGVVVAPLSADDFIEITDLRLLLEPYLLKCSAPHLATADLDAADAILRRNDHAKQSIASHTKEHWAFHKALYCKASRPRAESQIDLLYISINRYLLPAWSAVGLSGDWDSSHLQITGALRSGNTEEAAEMISRQIQAAAARVLDFFTRNSF